MGELARDRARVIHSFVKTATIAALVGLVVLHPTPFGKLLTATTSTFRKAVNLA